MDKLKMHSPDLSQGNIEKIRNLFPNCVTEAKDANGNLKLAIDFDQLKQELSDSIVEGSQERYHLNWPGKREALLTANAPIAKTLRPCRDESVNFDETENLFIEGDNLDALKLIQESYLEAIKLIFIDPPYNRGDDLLYKDNFVTEEEGYLFSTGQQDAEGNKLIANKESNGRFHSDWLNMMYMRLKVARNVLSEDGLIVIAIDDNEVSNLTKLCNEVFGENNHLGTILWKKKTNGNNVGHIPPVHDYLLCYAKAADSVNLLGFPLTQEFIDSTYSNPDDDPRGPWTTSDLSANHEGPLFEIINPNTGKSYWPAKGRYWVFNETEVKKRIQDGRIIFGKTGQSGPIQKKFLKDRESNRMKPESWWDDHGYNSDGTSEVAKLFVPKVFDHPKPTKLLENIIDIATTGEDIVLDFFAGSGSTFHAVMSLNSKDGQNRKCISVQVQEKCKEKSIAFKQCGFEYISELTKERYRRAGNSILAGKVNSDWNRDIGFRVLKIDDSNMTDVFYRPEQINQSDLFAQVENIKEDRTDEDLLFQVLLDWGVGLTLPISKQQIASKDVFFVNAGDDNEGADLIACFSSEISNELIKELAEKQPLRVVFRDDGFNNDSTKINVEQIFKQISPMTDVKSI